MSSCLSRRSSQSNSIVTRTNITASATRLLPMSLARAAATSSTRLGPRLERLQVSSFITSIQFRQSRQGARRWVAAAAAAQSRTAAMGGGGAERQQQPAEACGNPGQPPVLLLDIMDTVVYDPFFQDMPRFFGITFKELLAAKHPTAWVQVRGTGACSRVCAS